MIKKVIPGGLFVLGLIYLLIPGPTTINDFKSLPNSFKSELSGDTWQNPNIAAYFSDFRRDYITSYYRRNLEEDSLLGKIIPSFRLNHPPEEAYSYIRNQQESTFLEEYYYPLRESLYVNGYDPLVEDGMPIDFVSDHIEYKGEYYNTKTTLRFYPTEIPNRLFVYFGICLSIWGLYQLIKRERKYRFSI